MTETHKRSILKTITYRITSVIVTTLVALAVTRELTLSLAIGLFDTLVKLWVYYFHGRIWAKIKFGKGKIEYQI